jgi:putative transposase
MFRVSQSCYRYESKTNAENEQIAQWLMRLTDNHRTWGFGLCFLYLRNVKRFGWNHKRVYRIYRELELNLRIKPRKRLVRDKPQALTVPSRINEVWSMDFMHDMLDDGRAIRLFNVLDDFNREARDGFHELGKNEGLQLPLSLLLHLCAQKVGYHWVGLVLEYEGGGDEEVCSAATEEAVGAAADGVKGGAGVAAGAREREARVAHLRV